jgi:outer membrane protein OmpA-like peptidoglycan-associated protein
MKMKILLYVSLAVCAIFVHFPKTYGQDEVWNNLFVKSGTARLEGDKVAVKFDIVLEDYPLPANGQLVLTPFISDGKGNEAALPEVVVNSRRRDNVYRRMLRLNRKDNTAYRVIRVQSGKAKGTIAYNSQADYEKWMNNASVYLYADLCGCGDASFDAPGIVVVEKLTLPQLPVFKFAYTPQVTFVRPPKEETKKREESGTAYIMFLTGQSTIRPDLFNNRAELEKIASSINYVKDEPAARITSISIEAHSSPEGTYQSNLELSERRANSLREYVSRHFDVSSHLIRSVGMGEDWDGLVKLIEADTSIENRMEILYIIREVGIFAGREKQLMDLSGGRPYRYMLSRLFPRLRRSYYRIEYTVPGFTVERGKELLVTRPGLLSLEELYIIADSYEKGSDAFNNVFEVAVRQYPENTVANLNAAAARLLGGDAEKAGDILANYTDTPQAWNNLGVLMMERRQLDEAEGYLSRAYAAGVEEAAFNLDILEELREAVVDYEAARQEYDQYRRKARNEVK